MKGLEISRKYFEEFGMPMLEEQFADIMPYIAVGLIGSGSECLGFDDEISRDHDFEPGFCMFLPDETIVDRRKAFLLERAYSKLPKEFMGIERQKILPVGGARHGVFRTSEFFAEKIGSPDGNLSLSAWLNIPGYALAEAVGGQIFFDNYGQITHIRNSISKYPDDIRLKKLAGHLLLAAQSGQYNFMRCIKHGENAAAQLAANEFVKSCISTIFLLNNVYEPFYKWSFRALRLLPVLSLEAEILEVILTTDNEGENAEKKADLIESVAADIIDELKDQNLSEAVCGDLEKHAYSVNDRITQTDLRTCHILSAI